MFAYHLSLSDVVYAFLFAHYTHSPVESKLLTAGITSVLFTAVS